MVPAYHRRRAYLSSGRKHAAKKDVNREIGEASSNF
jgi:hypothetical protein